MQNADLDGIGRESRGNANHGDRNSKNLE